MSFIDRTTVLKELKCDIINIDNGKESSGLAKLTRINSEKMYLIELTFLDTGFHLKVKFSLIYGLQKLP
jgi:hypothetical protein